MNRALPPGDRQRRGFDPGGAPGSARAVSGTGGLVAGAADDRAGVGPESRKARHGRTRAGRKYLRASLLGDAVDALAILALHGCNREPHLLPQGAADEPADAVRLPGGSLHQLAQSRSLGSLDQAQDHGGLAALADAIGFWLSGFLGRPL